VSYLFLGSLADLEHLWAVAVALPLGRRLVGPHAVGTPMWAGRRNRRLLAASGLAVIAVAEIVLLLFPADSPLGSTLDLDASAWGVALTVTVVGLIGPCWSATAAARCRGRPPGRPTPTSGPPTGGA
jgi:phosphatidylglycerol lysyltransferase